MPRSVRKGIYFPHWPCLQCMYIVNLPRQAPRKVPSRLARRRPAPCWRATIKACPWSSESAGSWMNDGQEPSRTPAVHGGRGPGRPRAASGRAGASAAAADAGGAGLPRTGRPPRDGWLITRVYPQVTRAQSPQQLQIHAPEILLAVQQRRTLPLDAQRSFRCSPNHPVTADSSQRLLGLAKGGVMSDITPLYGTRRRSHDRPYQRPVGRADGGVPRHLHHYLVR